MFGWFSADASVASRSSRSSEDRRRRSTPADDLQRDLATEPRIEGAIDLTHAAGAEQRADVVGAEGRADGRALDPERDPRCVGSVGIERV